MKFSNKLIITVIPLTLLISCNQRYDTGIKLQESLSFYVSFDNDFKADFSLGDPELYTAPSWEQRRDYELFELLSDKEEYLQLHHGEGRYGDALWMDSEHSPVFFFRGEENMPYETENWSGTISFWMQLDPARDLHPGYSDPIQITSRGWNDGAIFVDFTEEVPRIFRFAIFADRDVWDPEHREWGEIPVDERPMVDVRDLPFSRNEWTHIALSFQNFNTGLNNGIVDCYINGEKIGTLEGNKQTFTWNPEEVVIWLGYNYRGYFDELSIFNRYLSGDEIYHIYSLENGVREILDTSK